MKSNAQVAMAVLSCALSLLDRIFGCSHKRCGFPITVRGAQRRSPAASLTGTYVVCLNCGQEFPYDWNEMKTVRKPSRHNTALAVARRRVA
jgi:hypothetical protein